MASVAFYGLGNMGLPMAANLVKAGNEVRGFDVFPEAMRRAREQGIRCEGDEGNTAKGAEFVISMLPGDEQMLALHTSAGCGLLEQADAQTTFIDCSTTSVQAARAFHEEARRRGIASLDAPVSGGITGAKNATLSFIAGGETGALERARHLLEAMGAKVFHAGGAGNGQLAKICNNMLLSIQMIGTGEAFGLAQANGLDPAVLSEIMKESSGANWCLQKYNPYPGIMEAVPSSNGYKGGFLTALMVKDSDLAMRVAEHSGADVPLGTLANKIFREHLEDGNEGLDFGSVIRKFVKTET